jgi:hypothetical protein
VGRHPADREQNLDGLRASARPSYADPLLQVLAQHAEMAGWLLQDSGDLDAAAAWSRRAGEWAQCAGDANLTAYMLVRQSNIAVLAHDHAAVVQLAAAARSTRGAVDPKLSALALQQQARGHARLGEHRECFAILDQAAGALARHPDVTVPGAPAYLNNYDLRALTEQSAACYQVTGQADRAVTILEDTITGVSPALVRDRGHLAAKLAVALTRARQPDPARAATLDLTPSPLPARRAPPASSANCAPWTGALPPSGLVTAPAVASERRWPHKDPVCRGPHARIATLVSVALHRGWKGHKL